MKKTLILFVAMAFIAFGFIPGAFAGLGKSMSDQEIGPNEYYGGDEGLREDSDEDSDVDRDLDTRKYYGTDEGIKEGFDRDRDLDTRQYYGSDEGVDEGFDANRDLDPRIDSDMESEESVDNLR